METKTITTAVELKADGEGQIEAIFSTFGVPDRDGDIVEAGAIQDGQSVAMVWAHDWTQIIGKGVTRVNEQRAVFDGQLFIDTPAGRSAYDTIKAMDGLMEYSWGFMVHEADYQQRDGEYYRIIKRAELFEVSPVLIGAGIGTGTLSLKTNTSLSEHGNAVVSAVDAYVSRVRSRSAFRVKEGRVLSTASRDRLSGIADALSAASADLVGILKETEPAKSIDMNVELLRRLAARANSNGVKTNANTAG